MHINTFATLIVQHLGTHLSTEQVKQIYLRNSRFLPPQLLDDYQSIVLLETRDVPEGQLDARHLETLCNRVSKRLLYAAKTHNERFTELRDVIAEPSVDEARMHLEELFQMLSLEEQTYLAMKLEGYTLREIAANIGVPISTAHHRWKQIVSKVKAMDV